MISLTITVDNIGSILTVFDTIQVRKYTGDGIPPDVITDLVALSEFTTISGIDTINNRTDVSDVLLTSQYSQYYFTDPDGYADEWYISRYYDSGTDSTSGWSSPIQGDAGDLYYNPQFPDEISYGSADQLIIDRIRLYIGDPKAIRREYGSEALSSIHLDGKTYEMDEPGWPVYVNMGGIQYTTTDNPSVNGYKFLRFKTYIDDICDTCVTYSGACGEDVVRDVTNGIDIWYSSFRHSDRQIMEAYDSCPPPTPLTTANANSEVYMLQTAIDILMGELWEDSTEDGAKITDADTSYDPTGGLETRRKLLADLIKRKDAAVKSLQLLGISGVLLD